MGGLELEIKLQTQQHHQDWNSWAAVKMFRIGITRHSCRETLNVKKFGSVFWLSAKLDFLGVVIMRIPVPIEHLNIWTSKVLCGSTCALNFFSTFNEVYVKGKWQQKANHCTSITQERCGRRELTTFLVLAKLSFPKSLSERLYSGNFEKVIAKKKKNGTWVTALLFRTFAFAMGSWKYKNLNLSQFHVLF